MPRRSLGCLLLLAGFVGLPSCRSKEPPDRTVPPPRHVVLSDVIREPSGLVRSRRHPGVFWTHGDSGCEPYLHAIASDGALMKSVRVRGGSCSDWEDITTDDAGNLYIADTGNNMNVRRDLAVHRVPEPDPANVQAEVDIDRTYRIRYEEQRSFPDPSQLNFDAEALFWAKGHLYLLTKHRGDMHTSLLRIPEEAAVAEVALRPLGRFRVGGDGLQYGGMVTGADATDDGRFLAVLTYHALFVFEWTEQPDVYFARQLNRVDLRMSEVQQIESVAWDGWSVLLGNEDRKLYRLDNPFAARSDPFP